MIREATLSDIPVLLAMWERFAEVAKLSEHVGYDPESMGKSFAFMIEDENCIVLLSENGAIGGQKAPHPFNHAHWIAQELFWWSEGRDGLRLLTAFEQWSRDHCHSLRMIALDAVEPVRTGELYQRLGFNPLEHGYIKIFP